ncbi:MAG: DUF4258 domain-containing protein [Ignavibacteria bacterium]|nr:DUF4258 domain-containing protein [Ignavibacteria bacterium]
MKIKFTKHALEEMRSRGFDIKQLESILKNPGQIVDTDHNRKVYQELIEFIDKKKYVVRIIVEETFDALNVVTVYKSSKISKYWRENES